ncbi:hypothetical protein V8E55_008295 [Tylopilus felleus]
MLHRDFLLWTFSLVFPLLHLKVLRRLRTTNRKKHVARQTTLSTPSILVPSSHFAWEVISCGLFRGRRGKNSLSQKSCATLDPVGPGT